MNLMVVMLPQIHRMFSTQVYFLLDAHFLILVLTKDVFMKAHLRPIYVRNKKICVKLEIMTYLSSKFT